MPQRSAADSPTAEHGGVLAYLGPRGTFTEQAARAMAPRGADERGLPGNLQPQSGISEVIAAVRSGSAELGCVPVENSVEGVVTATVDAMTRGEPVVALAETVLPVAFSLLARDGTTRSGIRSVATHPHAAAQTRRWMARVLPEAAVYPATSTAAAAAAVAAGEYDAALAAPLAAEHYELVELARDVLDVGAAFTRFLLLSRPTAPPEPTGADRTSFAVVAADRVGTLHGVLAELALRGINLTRIESRPTTERLGEYRFVLDCEGHICEPRLGDALMALYRHSRELRFLGSYPKAEAARRHDIDSEDEEYRGAAAWLAAIREGGAQ